MTRFDHKRLNNSVIGLDVEGLRSGIYSDQYFSNIVHVFEQMRAEGYRYHRTSPRSMPVDPAGASVADIIVEAQIFNRRAPFAVVAGVDVALAMLRHGAGYMQNEAFVEAWQDLEVVAVEDGARTSYRGDPNDVETVIEIRGRFRDFTRLETPVLGVLTRASRIATNVYETLVAANGKRVLFLSGAIRLTADPKY